MAESYQVKFNILLFFLHCFYLIIVENVISVYAIQFLTIWGFESFNK